MRLDVFVTPHAMRRFRDRIADLPDDDIIAIVREQAGRSRVVIEQGRDDIVLQGWYDAAEQHEVFYMVLSWGEGSRPVVTTVMGCECVAHARIYDQRASRRRATVEYVEGHIVEQEVRMRGLANKETKATTCT